MNEFELIDFLTKNIPKANNKLLTGIGDDCAVIKTDKYDVLVTTDALFEKVHFDLEYTDLFLLGRKSINVNLSDIAAMGGIPLFYTIALGVPDNFPKENLQKLYQGMLSASKECNAILIGGDTCKSTSGFVISITMIGKVKTDKAILRSTARKGDLIYVTGDLGDAALGLKCLKNNLIDKKYFIDRFNNPTARISCANELSKTNYITSMIDISDGLLADLRHIAEKSQVGIKLNMEKIPLSDGFMALCAELKVNPVELSLAGGEDYELVFTINKDFQDKFYSTICNMSVKITQIGYITDKKGEFLILDRSKPINISNYGFDHFKN